MKKGKLGVPRPFGLGLQFNSRTDRPTNIPEVVRENYVDEIKELLELQRENNAEIKGMFQERNGKWEVVNTFVGEETRVRTKQEDLYSSIELGEDGFVQDRTFTLHTHPSKAFYSHMNFADISSTLNRYSMRGPKYMGGGSILSKDDPDNISIASLTTPTGDFSSKDLMHFERATDICVAMKLYSTTIGRGESGISIDVMGRGKSLVEEGIQPGDMGSEHLAKPGVDEVQTEDDMIATEFKEIRQKLRVNLEKAGFLYQTSIIE